MFTPKSFATAETGNGVLLIVYEAVLQECPILNTKHASKIWGHKKGRIGKLTRSSATTRH